MSEAFYVPLLISTGLNLITALFATKPTQKAPKPNLRVPKSDYGSPLPKIYGKVRIEGNKFWPDTKDRMYRVETSTETQGGKGFGGGQKVETKTVYGTFAVLFAQGHCYLDRIIVNGKQIDTGHNFYQSYCTWFDGTQTSPWSEIVAKDDSPYNGIAYKGVNYIGFKDLPLEEYGNQIPQQISAVISDADFGTQPTLDLVVSDICQRGGLNPSLFDFTELQSIILRDGLIVPENGEGYRKTLEDLMGFYLFTAVETTEGIIKFKKFDRGGFTPIVIDPQQYFPVSDGGIDNQLFIKTTEPKQTLPNKIIIKYNNINQNWDTDEIVEYFEEYTKENSISLDTALTSYPYEIKERARLILRHLFLQQRNSYTFSLPATYLNQLNLLDLITLPNGETVQIHQLNLSADFKLDVTAKYYGGGISYTYTPSDPENEKQPPTLNDPTLSIPNFYILDIPQIENYSPNNLYLMATGLCLLQASIDNGATWNKSVYHQSVSVIGNINNVVGDFTVTNPNDIDQVNYIDITLQSGDFPSISDPEFLSGYGLGLIGKINTGSYTANGNTYTVEYFEGELVQYRDVQVTGTNTRRLSYLKRKLFNTLYTNVQTKFFLLKSVQTYYSLFEGSAELLGKPILFRPIVASWQNLATTPIKVHLPVGNAYKPPPPSNLSGIIDVDGNIKMFWDYDATQSPYDNYQESVTFDIDVLNGVGSVVRTLQSSQKNVIYTVLDRNADGIPTSFDVTIYAVSSVVGRGFPYTATLVPVLVDDNIFSTGDGIAGIKFIYDDYTVTEADLSFVLVVVNPNPTTIILTFPPHSTVPSEPDLSNGFTCYAINQKSNNNSAKVEMKFDFTYTGLANNFITTGNSARIFHISQGKYFVFGNSTNLFGYEQNVINITGSYQLESNTLYEVIAPATLTFPPTPIRGDLIHIVDSPGTFRENNYVTLVGNGYNIEGATTFRLDKKDDNIEFYFNGDQWVYKARFFYLDYRDIHPLLVDGNNDFFPVVEVAGEKRVQITPSAEFIEDTVANALQSGENINIVYDDNANTITISMPNENIDDRVANLLQAGTNISLSYNDVANTLTISSTGGSNDTLPVSVSTTYTLQISDNKKWVKANGTFTISMPSSPPNYYEAIIQNVGTGTITISGITNAVGTKLTTRWTACHVYYDGTSWTAVGALTV